MAPPAKPPSSRRPGARSGSRSGSASGTGGRGGSGDRSGSGPARGSRTGANPGPGTRPGPKSHKESHASSGNGPSAPRGARSDSQRSDSQRGAKSDDRHAPRSEGQRPPRDPAQTSGQRPARPAARTATGTPGAPTGPRAAPGTGARMASGPAKPRGDFSRSAFPGKSPPPRKIVYANRPRSDTKTEPTPRAADRPEGDRIAKLLARAGVASRREIERMIEDGRIALHGETLDTPATILTSLQGVTVDGNPVQKAEPARLFMFHKPAGCLTAERDPKGRPTIYDRLPEGLPRLVPVGRLDYNTEGLLLLTNDGGLKRQLELPSTGVERTYRARAFGEISQAQLEDLVMGIEIDGVRYGRIEANLERRTGRNTWIEMTLTEGKNREVRRVLEHFGLEVSRLIRTRYGSFVLGDSAMGAVEEVGTEDLNIFRKTLK